NAKLKSATRISGGTNLSAPMATAIDYMASNLDCTINISDIATVTNRSPSHLARMFRSEIGMPPHRYLIILRINKAQRLLAKSSMPIAVIAIECGFSHQEHLTRLFRRHLGTTPAAYRRSKQN